jgi:hypothetical protein
MKHLAWPAELLSLRPGVQNTSLDTLSDIGAIFAESLR